MKLTTRDLALISYGYALRTADEILEQDKVRIDKLNLSKEEYQVYRENVAKMIIEESKYLAGEEFLS